VTSLSFDDRDALLWLGEITLYIDGSELLRKENLWECIFRLSVAVHSFVIQLS